MTLRSAPLKTLNKLGIVAILALVVWLAPSLVHAQVANIDEVSRPQTALMAIPPRLGDDGTLEADPGETIQTEVRLRNTTDQAVVAGSFIEDFVIGEDGKTPVPVLEQTNSRWSLAQWMRLGATEVRLAPHTTQTISVTITVPEDAHPGGRYAMIMHQPVRDADVLGGDGQVQSSAGINQRVGTLVYLRVNGPVSEAASIRNLRIPTLTEFGPVPIQFEIENRSDIHIRPQTTIEIKNIWGRTVDTIVVETKNVFPSTQRLFETEWDRVWGFGRYTAHVTTVFGESSQVTSATAHFWLIPYTLILAILVVLIALTGIGVAIRRHLLHRSQDAEQHVELLEERIRQLEEELHHS